MREKGKHDAQNEQQGILILSGQDFWVVRRSVLSNHKLHWKAW